MPVHTVDSWLDEGTADALLDYAIENEAQFKPGEILYATTRMVDDGIRRCVALGRLGRFKAELEDRAHALVPELAKRFGIPAFNISSLEIELAAHGDGAHFHRHIDTLVVCHREPTPRVLTMVLYLHRRPCAYSGGMVRMYALGSSEVMDFAPDHNRLIAWPSIAPHSVERVVCPSGAFADRRFALNIFVHG